MKTMIRLFFLGIVFIFPQAAEAQLLSLSGYVKNFITGEPVENAAIYEADSGIGTITNKDGYYKLLLQKGEQRLKISSTGSESYNATFVMVSDTIISVELKPLNFSGNSVVAGNKVVKDSVFENENSSSTKKRR
ncbi:carboxypeptidase-like regulatory domain-containing protein [Mariniphaga sp.]|uniref:carboxypeptidase-like regulatory domain-containing protein n=1 Tax=Mariniphaga sp. TaxID=1954475 RepID=UPI0035693D10